MTLKDLNNKNINDIKHDEIKDSNVIIITDPEDADIDGDDYPNIYCALAREDIYNKIK
jgi:hypothetical protein